MGVGISFSTDEHDPDEGVEILQLPLEWVGAFVGQTATCEMCGDDWPAENVVSVVWTDPEGEEWERRACSSCREEAL